MATRITAGEAVVGSLALPGVKMKTMVAKLSGAIAASETVIGTLPANAVVLDLYVSVASLPSGTTLAFDIGTLSSASGGDADGFADSLPVNSLGVKIPSLVGAAQTLGALLKESVTDSAAATVNARVPATIGTVNRSVTLTGVSAMTGFNGKVVIRYLDLT